MKPFHTTLLVALSRRRAFLAAGRERPEAHHQQRHTERSHDITPVSHYFAPMHQRCFAPRMKMSPSENAGDANTFSPSGFFANSS